MPISDSPGTHLIIESSTLDLFLRVLCTNERTSRGRNRFPEVCIDDHVFGPFPNQKSTPSFVTQPTRSYTLQRLPVGPLIPRLTIRSFLHSSRKQDINGTNENLWYLTKIVPADDVEFPFLICWILHRFWGEFPW